jgi:hypothetical protein
MSSENWKVFHPINLGLLKVLAYLQDSGYKSWLYGVSLFSIFMLVLYLIQFSTPNLVGTDGYYHIKFAYLMRLEGLKPGFPWLPLTILNPGEFSDHHFLYHVGLIPFTFGDLIQGAKWASVFFTSLVFLSVWWLFHSQNIPYAGLWTLGLLAASEAFLYRMSMPRTQSLSLAILVLGLNFLLLRKYKFLLPLSFLYVWLYDAFPLLIVLTIIYILSAWLIEGNLDLRPLYFALAGVALGLLINPYFPQNIIFLVRHLIPKVAETSAVRVGNEWYPYETSQLLENSPFTLILFLSGAAALGLRSQRMDTRTATALFMAMFCGLLLFQSRRFIEYFPPFALIFAALAWSPLIANLGNESPFSPSGTKVQQSIKSMFGFTRSNTYWMVGIGLAAVVLFGIWFTTRTAQASLQDTTPTERYSRVSSWLIKNTPQHARIFQTDWDDFPRLFFYNTWNTYLIGLDPTYLYLKDPDLFDLWVKITQGRVQIPSESIYQRFAAEYVFTDLSHEKFIDRASEDSRLEELYRDEEAIVYQVLPSRGD